MCYPTRELTRQIPPPNERRQRKLLKNQVITSSDLESNRLAEGLPGRIQAYPKSETAPGHTLELGSLGAIPRKASLRPAEPASFRLQPADAGQALAIRSIPIIFGRVPAK